MRARDVVVVGGGPAGAATALWLARAGHDVELLERRPFPRAKACGDCISAGANPIFKRLGVYQDLAATAAQLTGWRLSCGSARFSSTFCDSNHEPETNVAFAIARDRLDALLLRAALQAGVTVRTNAHVTQLLRTPAGAVTGVQANIDGTMHAVAARLTIGADGLRSRVGRVLGAYARTPRLRKLSLTAHLRVPNIGSVGELYIQDGACLGIAPVQTGCDPLCNVTTVVHAPGAAAHGGPRELMRDALRRFGRSDLAEAIAADSHVMASGPFDWPTREIIFDGAALAGDAAGYYDPFTGQGIFQALAGAELLAESAGDALRNLTVTKDALHRYAVRQQALVKGARRVQRAIEYVCARPRVARAAFDALDRVPMAAARLIAVTGDVRPARDLLSPALLTRLLLAAVGRHSTT